MYTTNAVKATLVLAGLGLAGFAFGTNSAVAQEPTIVGRWTLNKDESDDPREMMREARGQGPLGRPPGGGMGGGPGGGRRPRFGGPGRGGNPERMGNTMQMVMRAVQQIEIARDDSTVTVTFGDRPPLQLRTNGKKQKLKLEDIGEVEFKSLWEQNELVMERKVGGIELKQWYKPSPDGTQLYVITQVKGGRFPDLLFRRVYDRM